MMPVSAHASPDEIARLVPDLLIGGAESGARRPFDELRRTRDRIDGILQFVSDGVTVADFTGRFAYANDVAATLFGQPSPAALLLTPLPDSNGSLEIADAAGREVSLPDLPARLASCADASGELLLRLRTRDGSGQPRDRYCMARTAALRDERQRVLAVVTVYRDITDQKRSEDGLRFLARAGALLVGSLDPDALLDGVARLLVPEMADFCAIDLDGRPDEPPRAIVAHREPGRAVAFRGPSAAAVRAMRTQRAESITLETPAPGSETEHPELQALGLTSAVVAPLFARGRIQGAITIGTTPARPRFGPGELGLAWDLAGRLALALDNARLYAEARETDRRKDEFLAMLAHELRNPLAPVVTALALLKSDTPPADERRLRSVMDRQIGHLTRLVDDLLDVSRITRGKIELRRESADLSTVIARAIETSGPLLDAQRQHVVVTLPTEPVKLFVDPVRLTQVLANLLNNAARYSAPGGLVRVDCSASGRELVLRVRDEGIGMEPDQFERIFEPFVQGNPASGQSKAGLGIGLTLARGIVELHGGTLRAFSEGVGRGSELCLRLPLPLPREDDELPTPSLRPHSSTAASPRRVLVVDDNVDAAELLAEALRAEGHEVEVAHEALAALQLAAERLPEVAVLDIGLPGLSGHELALRLRELAAGRPLRLVALSGYGQEADRRRSLEAGFDGHYTKPIDLVTLAEAIRGPPA